MGRQLGLMLTLAVVASGQDTTSKIASDFSLGSLPDSSMTTSSSSGLRVAVTTVTAVFSYEPTDRAAVDTFVKSSGVTLVRDNPRVGAMTITLASSRVAELAAIPSVSFITPDRKILRNLEYAQPAVYGDIALRNNFTGSNIGIAVIDSGVNTHGDLSTRVVYSENFVTTERTTADLYGHGTHVAVIAAGNAAQSSGSSYTRTFRGLAPAARIINLRVLDANGAGTDSAVIAAIDRAIELKSRYNIRVMNLSLGRPVRETFRLDPLCRAVKRAYDAGIVVVVAAGNRGRDNSAGTQGYGTIGSPGNSPYVITVGAMRDNSTTSRADDLLATYSSKGPTVRDYIVKPDLVAPGNQIVAGLSASNATLAGKVPTQIVQRRYYQNNGTGNGPYLRLSGTSMATPVVAGAVALMLHKDPTLSPDTVKARLMRTASHSGLPPSYSYAENGVTYTVQHDIFSIGAGYLDVWAALNSTAVVPATRKALSPRAIKDPVTGKMKLDASNILWGENVVWGDSTTWSANVVWGNTLLWGDNILWGDTAPWGNATSSAYNLLWGDNILWGDSIQFPESLSFTGDR